MSIVKFTSIGTVLPAVIGLLLVCSESSQATLVASFDVNLGTSPNQSGYEALNSTSTGTQNSITLTSSSGLDEYRDRGVGALSGHPLASLLRDFSFENDGVNPKSVTFDLTGLLANTQYDITIYSHDPGANNGTTSDWYDTDDSGSILNTHTIVSGDPDAADFTLNLTSDGTGAIRIYAETTSLIIFNGMQVTQVPEPSSMLLCGLGGFLLLRRRR